MPHPPFDAIIFDNDGVLVDSEVLSNRVLSRLLTSYGLPTTFEESIALYVGRSMSSVREVAEDLLGAPIPDEFVRVYNAEVFAIFESELSAVESVGDVLWALREAGIPFCVASSGSPARIELTLGLTDLRDHFGDLVFSATQVEHGKPAPDLFLFAAEQMGCRPERCAVIEDSPLGVEGGNAAGMTTIGYAAMTPAARLDHSTGGVFSDMTELPGLLGLPGTRSSRPTDAGATDVGATDVGATHA
jgi:HAD superfamily hydrolase (TIGR01509 family)